MTWNRAREHQFITTIRAGGTAREAVLREIYLSPDISECIDEVLEKGGGEKEKRVPFLQDCLVFFDRWVRLFPPDIQREEKTIADLMKTVAQFLWSKKIARNAELRERVLHFVFSDTELRERTISKVTRSGGSRHDGEDAYQNGSIVLSQAVAARRYRGGAIKGYFLQICYNQWRNERKSTANHEPMPEEPEDLQLLHDQHEGSEIHLKLARAFKLLSPRCQEVILLKYFVSETLANPDIAERMGLKNAQNAANLLSRCRDRLWDLYGGKDSKDEQ